MNRKRDNDQYQRWNWQYFGFDEMSSPDEDGVYHARMDKWFMRRLVVMRYDLGTPLRVTSAYRTPHWNKEVGGVPDSMHVKGRAVDVWVPTAHEAGVLMRLAIHHGFKGIGLKSHGATKGRYMHLDDSDGPLSIWTYP